MYHYGDNGGKMGIVAGYSFKINRLFSLSAVAFANSVRSIRRQQNKRRTPYRWSNFCMNRNFKILIVEVEQR
jgi:hypothetical protein